VIDKRSSAWGRAARIGLVIAVAALTLAPSWASPSRTITVPVTQRGTFSTPPGVLRELAFPATHVAFSWTGDEGSAVAYRTFGARRTGWRVAEESHDLEHGTRHYSAVLVANRATALEWRSAGRSPATEVVVSFFNTLDGPRRRVVVPSLAGAKARTPDIVTRAEWGADESLKRASGGCRRTFHPVQQLFVHHTAGSNRDPHPAATMRAIYDFHVRTRGWCDIGYNFVIARDGRLFEGRWARPYKPWEVHTGERDGAVATGAHVSGFNSGSVGISLMGDFTGARPSRPARRTLVRVLAWEADRHNLRPRGRHLYRNPETGLSARLPYIAGHRDAGTTACPGDRLYRARRRIRRRVAERIGDGKRNTSLSAELVPRRITYGETVRAFGRLRTGAGDGLAARPVHTYLRPAGGTWRLLREVQTVARGRWSFISSPPANSRVVAAYDGGRSTWGSQSKAVRVRVSPRVGVSLQGGTIVEGVKHYAAGTPSIGVVGRVAPPHTGRVVKVVVRKTSASGLKIVTRRRDALDDAGRYALDVPTPGAGSYKVRAGTRRHKDHAAGRSDSRPFVVDAG
jgi:N-acetylmuramoyl-L-alanine amidase